jgi:hypothetical protein
MKPFRLRVTIIWWTEGGLTPKWRWRLSLPCRTRPFGVVVERQPSSPMYLRDLLRGLNAEKTA